MARPEANLLGMGPTTPRGAEPERSDRDLVLDFKDGCGSAYESIYRRHHERVHMTCLKILKNPADAAEATQETFLKAFKALGRFNGQYQLGAWLAAIARNVAVDQLRARQRSVNVVAGTDDVIHLEDERRSPDAEVADKVDVHLALDELQPLHAEALRLQAVEGMSHKQIAERLRMSAPQVKSLLHRSRHSFKKAWEKASGWALAPLGLSKGWRARHDSTGSLLSVSPATGAVLERFAASAMAAVVAVAGFATTRRAEPVPSGPRPVQAAPEGMREEIDTARLRHAIVSSQPTAEQGPSAIEALEYKVAEILDVDTTIRGELKPEAPETEQRDEGAIPLGQGKRSPLPDDAKRVLRDVEERLGDPTDGADLDI